MIIETENSGTHLAELDDGQPIFTGIADEFLCKCGEKVIKKNLYNLGDVDVTCEKCLEHITVE